MSNRTTGSVATLEDCVSVLLDRGADLLEGAGSVTNVDGAILFNLRVWAAVRALTGRLADSNPRAAALASYADYATSGMMSRPVEGGTGLGALAHLDRHAAQFVLRGGTPARARDRVVRRYGEAAPDGWANFDAWLLAEVRAASLQATVG